MSRGRHIMRPRPAPLWPIRLAAIVMGSLSIAAGLVGFRDGRYWVTQFNPRMDTVTTGPVLSFVLLGALILLFGIVPWPKSQPPLKPRKEHKWRTHI
jgi:hypothetical protein